MVVAEETAAGFEPRVVGGGSWEETDRRQRASEVAARRLILFGSLCSRRLAKVGQAQACGKSSSSFFGPFPALYPNGF